MDSSNCTPYWTQFPLPFTKKKNRAELGGEKKIKAFPHLPGWANPPPSLCSDTHLALQGVPTTLRSACISMEYTPGPDRATPNLPSYFSTPLPPSMPHLFLFLPSSFLFSFLFNSPLLQFFTQIQYCGREKKKIRKTDVLILPLQSY